MNLQTFVEIRASEGGKDSKLLIEDMSKIYLKACSVNNFVAKVFE